MINYKLQHQLIGEENWPELPSVFIKGVPDETDIDSAYPKNKKESRIQTWKNIAVLSVTSSKPTKFYLGYANLGIISYLKHEFTTNLKFGMRIGGGDVRIFIIPLDLTTNLKLDLVEITDEDDSKYFDLIVI